jgi:ArsR family transcriptional regulator
VSELAPVFRALSDPNRLAIYQLIRERDQASVADLERSISALAREFDLTLSTVSHHIKELRQAGLIRCVKRGQTVYCEADPAALAAIERFLGESGGGNDQPGIRRVRAGGAAPRGTAPRRRQRAAGARTAPAKEEGDRDDNA